MTVRFLRFGAVLLALAATPALAQQNNNFFGNLFKPPGQVGSGATAPVAEGAPVGDAAGLSMRLDRLENQLRQMTGQIEQLQYRNQQLEAQVKRFQEEVDYRLPGGAAAPAVRPPAGAPAPAGQPAKRSDAFDPNAQPAAPGAPRPLGTDPAATATAPGRAPGAPMDLGSLAGATSGDYAGPGAPPAGTQVATLPPTNSARDLYDLSYGYMLRQDYDQAVESFRLFVQQYPGDRALPDAYYWMGESDYLRQRYKEAATSYLKVSTDFPNAVKAPEALVRLGQSLAALGEKDAACATFNAVGNKYPRAPANVRQSVEREQKRVRC